MRVYISADMEGVTGVTHPEGPYTFIVEFATASTAAGVLHFPQLA